MHCIDTANKYLPNPHPYIHYRVSKINKKLDLVTLDLAKATRRAAEAGKRADAAEAQLQVGSPKP